MLCWKPCQIKHILNVKSPIKWENEEKTENNETKEKKLEENETNYFLLRKKEDTKNEK